MLFGVLFGVRCLLWFLCMLLGMLVGYACEYVSALFCMYACRVGYVSWAGLLLGRVLL